MQVANNYLFNFSASYSGGGYKRLSEYVKEFNSRGGAHFIIHPNCSSLTEGFINNSYHIVEQSKLERVLNDCAYLQQIIDVNGVPDLYYAYGIPVYSKVARVNWSHLSNVLPLAPQGIPMSPLDHIKMRFLGSRIRNNFINADVISAESNYSLDLIGSESKKKLFLSVNGSNDELAVLMEDSIQSKSDIAVVIGTHRYKALTESFSIFEMLRYTRCEGLKLAIIGSSENIPKYIRLNPNVLVKGLLPRVEVINCLRAARYYISTTYIENSYNAASEGIFFADESYISDIGPHKELMFGMPYEMVYVPNVPRSIMYIKRKEVSGTNIKSWEDVVSEMIAKVRQVLSVSSG
jgi:hypothetical protein